MIKRTRQYKNTIISVTVEYIQVPLTPKNLVRTIAIGIKSTTCFKRVIIADFPLLPIDWKKVIHITITLYTGKAKNISLNKL